jgi:hypothetical protein
MGKGVLAQGYPPARPMAFRMLMVRLTTLIICLHMLLDFVVGGSLSPVLLFNLRICSLLFPTAAGYGDLVFPRAWRLVGSDRKHYRCADVRTLSNLPICGRAQARRER